MGRSGRDSTGCSGIVMVTVAGLVWYGGEHEDGLSVIVVVVMVIVVIDDGWGGDAGINMTII